jgi:hypothetical protein
VSCDVRRIGLDDPPPTGPREFASGLVEPGTDEATCNRCGAQALLYVLDWRALQWFTCIGCHGYTVAGLLRGLYDDREPPLGGPR